MHHVRVLVDFPHIQLGIKVNEVELLVSESQVVDA